MMMKLEHSRDEREGREAGYLAVSLSFLSYRYGRFVVRRWIRRVITALLLLHFVVIAAACGLSTSSFGSGALIRRSLSSC